MKNQPIQNLNDNSTPATLPGWKKIIFASGNFGWSLGTYGIANLITYFYLPNITDGQAMFPPFIVRVRFSWD